MTPTSTNHPDSDTDEDHDEDDNPTAATPIDQLTALPPAQPLTDDEQNQLRRTSPFGLSHHTPHTTTNGHFLTFEVRTATHDSDSTPIYPNNSDSDDDHPGYWPEHRANTPPPSFPATSNNIRLPTR